MQITSYGHRVLQSDIDPVRASVITDFGFNGYTASRSSPQN